MKADYQIWLKAFPLNNEDKASQKSDVLFSSNLGRKSIFKLFDLLKSEVGILSIDNDADPVEMIFKEFADQDLETDHMIEIAINKYLKNLRDVDSLIENINKIIISLRKKKIRYWEAILNDYLEDKKKNNQEIKKLWLSRRINLED